MFSFPIFEFEFCCPGYRRKLNCDISALVWYDRFELFWSEVLTPVLMIYFIRLKEYFQ